MKTIELKQTLPAVFASRDDIRSDIWHQSVTLERGRAYLIEAGSGTGKSSLCSYLYGYRKDYEGIIGYDGCNIRTLTVKDWVEVRKRSLSLLFQELRLFPELTAYENVAIKNKLTGYCRKRQIEMWFDALGVVDKRDVRVGHMSFGQQQRVALIRALAQPFDFLLLDEPVSHLDDANAQAMADVLRDEMTARGAGLLVTSVGKPLPWTYDKIFRL